MRQPIITYDIQGSPEWMQSRVGVPGASSFDKIIDTKGNKSTQRQKLLYQFAGERLLGKKEESYSNAAMLRGVALEPEARSVFEMLVETEVTQCGFIYYDERKDRGCSPDGLIGEDGGIEVKCPSLATHISYAIGGKLPTDYYIQVMGSLFVTDRKYWYFMSYYPGLKPFIIKVLPDIDFINKLSIALDTFCDEINAIVEKIK